MAYEFYSNTGALNFLYKQGFEFVSTGSSMIGNSKVVNYILQKKND